MKWNEPKRPKLLAGQNFWLQAHTLGCILTYGRGRRENLPSIVQVLSRGGTSDSANDVRYEEKHIFRNICTLAVAVAIEA